MITALAIAAALSLGAEPPPKAPPPPPRKDASAPAPLSSEDAEVVSHLELLQKMEMLQDLPIVDTGGKDDDDK